MDLRRLSYFVAVAEELNFTRAAARLQISQPPLSQQIRRLEQEVGARLLERNSRHVRLTPAGEVLLDEARALLRHADETTRIAHRAACYAAGSVRIGSVSSAFSGVLRHTLRELHYRHPEVLPLVYEMEATPQREALSRRALDVGFMRTTDTTAGLSVTPVIEERYVAAIPSDHHLADRREIRLTDLRSEHFVLFPRDVSPEAFDNVIATCRTVGFTLDVVYEATNDLTMLGLVAAGLAVSVVPESTTNLGMPGVTYLTLEEHLPRSVVSVVTAGDQTRHIAAEVAAIAVELHRHRHPPYDTTSSSLRPLRLPTPRT